MSTDCLNILATFDDIKVTLLELQRPVGCRSIVDKASVYVAKGPGFITRWKQQFMLPVSCST